MLLSVLNFLAISSFNSEIPPVGVYFVFPSKILLIAASFMCLGVSKSGSPTA